ncbi:hypothetical protein Trydic_g23564 [Trypoxylus dichotomus]
MFAVLVLSFLIISLGSSVSKILFVTPTPPYNHQISFPPVWKELSRRSHQVAAITPNPLTGRELSSLSEIDKNFVQGLSDVNNVILSDPKLARLTRDTEAKFDVVIVEVILLTMAIFGHDVTGNKTHPDLQQFLDNAKDGAIHFSLGTNVKIAFLPENIADSMIEAFSTIPYPVLWKIDELNIPENPGNIRIACWIPQQHILRHPNVKVFIMEGGLPSIEEYVYFKNPIICISFCDDQFSNCIKVQNKDIGTVLDRKSITAKMVKAVITEVLDNQRYLTAVTRTSEITADQLITGLRKAVWWTEYVFRHKDVKHLRSLAVDMILNEYICIKVLGFLLGVVLVALYILWKVTKCITFKIRRNIHRKKGVHPTMSVIVFLTLVIASLTNPCDSARILFVASTPSLSHQVVFQPIWKELSLRGHQVTVITPSPLKDPKLTNLTEIDLSYTFSLVQGKYKFWDDLAKYKDYPLNFGKTFVQGLSNINQDELSDSQVQRLIKDSKVEFDVAIIEFLLPTMVAFGHRFKCPVIGITSLDGTLLGHDIMGNPTHPILNPESTLKFIANPTFFQKVYSVLYSILRRLTSYIILQNEDQVIAKFFGPGYPPLSEMAANIDLFFMNVNPAFHNVRPTVPAVIHIGGAMNIQPPKSLPKDIQEYLDSAENGAIYFSVGANIKTKYLSKQFLQSMYTAFSALPYKVLWKVDEVDPDKDRIDNILFVKWVPQQDVLRHPNLKVFITQGGLQSLEESIYLKKPMVCIPYSSDQFSNCLQVESKGMGLTLEYNMVTAKSMEIMIAEVAENKKYLEAVTKYSEIAKDQPMTGLEKAVWWTEYVIRHKGAKHLRSPAIDMPLYEYFLLDVLGFIFGVLFIVLCISYKINVLIIRWICRRWFGKKKIETKKKVKKN